MSVESLYDPSGNILIAQIIYFEQTKPSTKVKTEFVTDPDQPIQLGVLNRLQGTRVEPHRHLPVQRTISGSQEVLIVRSGQILTEIFDVNLNSICVKTLRAGDIFIQYTGGHSFQFVTDSEFIEIKQGPFTPEAKVFFVNPLSHEQMK